MDPYISPDSPVRLINRAVDRLDLTAVMERYAGGGCSCYSPRMLLNNLYSCRKIAGAMEENIHCLWLSGRQFPKYNTINHFRSLHLKEAVNGLFAQAVLMPAEMGYLTLKAEKNRARLEAKIRGILQGTEAVIVSNKMSPVEAERCTSSRRDDVHHRGTTQMELRIKNCDKRIMALANS